MLMVCNFEVHVCACFLVSGYLSGESLPCLTVSIGYLAVNQVAIRPDFMEIVCIYILYVSRRGTYYVCACRTLSFVILYYFFFSLAHVMNSYCLIHRKTWQIKQANKIRWRLPRKIVLNFRVCITRFLDFLASPPKTETNKQTENPKSLSVGWREFVSLCTEWTQDKLVILEIAICCVFFPLYFHFYWI